MTEQVTPEGFKQSIFNCTMRFRGSVIHTMPLEGVTKDELKLLAFLHSVDSLPSEEIKFVRKDVVVDRIEDDGTIIYVLSQDGEYRRLSRKYDTIVNSGRGKKYVETCFNTTLVDFGAVIDAVSPVDEMERRAAEAEAKTAVSEAAVERDKMMAAQAADADKPLMGQRVFASR